MGLFLSTPVYALNNIVLVHMLHTTTLDWQTVFLGRVSVEEQVWIPFGTGGWFFLSFMLSFPLQLFRACKNIKLQARTSLRYLWLFNFAVLSCLALRRPCVALDGC